MLVDHRRKLTLDDFAAPSSGGVSSAFDPVSPVESVSRSSMRRTFWMRIARHASRCLVLHGHRHRHWIGTSGDMVLCSTPSVTLGSHGEEKYRGSFYIHEFSTGAEEPIGRQQASAARVSQRFCAFNRRLRRALPTAAQGWLFIVPTVYVPHQLLVFELN
jgi:hypothetical protein